MTTSTNGTLEKEVDALVSSAKLLCMQAEGADVDLGADKVAQLTSIASRAGQVIQRIYGDGSHYEDNLRRVVSQPDFASMNSGHCAQLGELTGILTGVQHEVKSGLLKNLRRTLQAEIFTEFLETAERLLEDGCKDACAVLLGAVLENLLRRFAEAVGVATSSKGKPLSAEALNAALAKSGAYGPLVQKQIAGWADLRNEAVEGRIERYGRDEVQQMLAFLQKFCSEHLR